MKAERKRFTSNQSEDPSLTIAIYIKKEEKGKTVEDSEFLNNSLHEFRQV